MNGCTNQTFNRFTLKKGYAQNACDFSQDDTLTYFYIISFYFYFLLNVFVCHASTMDNNFFHFCSSYTFFRYITYIIVLLGAQCTMCSTLEILNFCAK